MWNSLSLVDDTECNWRSNGKLHLVIFFGESKIQLPECSVKTSADPELFSPNIEDKKVQSFILVLGHLIKQLEMVT